MKDNWFRHRPLFSPPQPQAARPPKRPGIGAVIGRTIRRTCTFIGGMILFSAALSIFLSFFIPKSHAPATLAPQSVLQLTLDGDLLEHQNLGPYAFGGRGLTIRQAVDALARAEKDDRIKAFVTFVKGAQYNIAHMQELRAAVKRFRDSGKPAYIYSDSYGDTGGGLGLYYLASAYTEIWMQPVGMISLPGMRAEMPYARAALERLGVTPEFFARKEYKSVFENFTADKMSPESRESMTALVDDIAGSMLSEIAASRGIGAQDFRAHVKHALFTEKQAVEAGLVDRVDYLDVLDSTLRADITGNPDSEDVALVEMEEYVKETGIGRAAPSIGKKGPRVALVYAVGAIMPDGQGEAGDLSSSDALYDNIMEAADDETVAAIVLRIDSPGGSPTAAETVRRAVVKAKEKGKKVIVSMGSMAASGGYWIAADADYIFAAPATLTGSIGVAGGKFVLDGTWQKLSLNWEAVEWGENAGIWSMNEPYSAAGRARMNEMMDSVYDAFIARVAAGRKITPERADEIARGRIWTGRQAQALGLVDALGGLDAALDYAARAVGGADRAGVPVLVLPKAKTPVEMLAEFLEYQVGVSRVMDMQARILKIFAPVLGLSEQQGVSAYRPAMILR